MIIHLQQFLKFLNFTMRFYCILNAAMTVSKKKKIKKNIRELFAYTAWIRSYIFYLHPILLKL